MDTDSFLDDLKYTEAARNVLEDTNVSLYFSNDTELHSDNTTASFSWTQNGNNTKPTSGFNGFNAIALGIASPLTIGGNLFVISAIAIRRSLRKKSNILITSLAVTDLMVGIILMPFAIYLRIIKTISITTDIVMTTLSFACVVASVCHLIAIALDRYWAVTNFKYMVDRSLKRIVFMVIVCWSVGLITSILHIIIVKFLFEILMLVSVFFVSVVYIKIYRVAKMNIKARLTRQRNYSHEDRKVGIERKKEMKAIRTLFIIVGAFVVCCCPFLVMRIYNESDRDHSINSYLISIIVTDLMFCNSTINPVIYTVFNPEFRAAFMRMFCKRSNRHGTRQ